MDETIKTILYYWMEKNIPNIKKRATELHIYLDIKPKKIIVVTGFRRAGKTFLIYGLMKELLEKHSKEEVLYINFNDERIPPRTEFLSELLPVIKSTFEKRTRYLFLDEVQEVPEWSKWLRRITDNEDFQIFVTGSSSKVSSREIPTELRGRALEVELYPLSFREFLDFNGISFDLKDIEYRENEFALLKKSLDEYLEYGGMPEVVEAPKTMKIEILQNYYRTVVAQDVIERFRVQNEEALKAMMLLLMNSTQYSVSKLHNTLKSQGHNVGKSTLISYIDHVASSYFLHPVYIFSTKVKDSMQYPRKPYFIDNGFITALSTRFGKDMGRYYENCIAIEYLRRGYRDGLFYWRDERGWEVDFVLRSDKGVERLVQVCYDLDNPETRDREMRSLVKASKELNCQNLYIINRDLDGIEEYRGVRIKLIPLWKFLLHEKA